VTKDFAIGLRGVRLRAVDQLSLRIAPGQVFGLLGANGSGKSTTLRIILGLAKPTRGRCTVFGVPSECAEARRPVGYLPESPYFYHYLSGRELIRFYGRMGGLHGRRLESRTSEVLDWCGLGEAANRRVGSYSKGMLQRVGLAQVLVHDPKLVILDEPTVGLDADGTATVLALIRQLKSVGKTVLLTSHLLGQMEEICDRVALLDHGRLVIEGAIADLTQDPEWQVLTVSRLPEAELAELREWLAERDRVLESVKPPPGRLQELVAEAAQRARARKD
jgi:ABC-2 type transport system ATP-binding protein